MKMVQKRSKISGISKKINLKLFRHTEATETAKFMTESQLRKRHGWSSNSRMPDRYVHIVNSDVDDALFEHYGIKKPKNTDKKAPQFCLICRNANPYDSTICSQCGKALDLETALEIEENEKNSSKRVKFEVNELKTELKASKIQNEQKICQLQNVVQNMAKEMTSRNLVIEELVKNWPSRNLKPKSAK